MVEIAGLIPELTVITRTAVYSAALGLTLAFGRGASAQTIDQQQTNVAALYLGRLGIDACYPVAPGCGSNGWYTQSFIPTMTTSAGAAFMLQPIAGVTSGTLMVELWNAAPQAVGASMLASGTTALGATQQFYSTFFTSAANVTPGQTYFLAFFSNEKYNVKGDYGPAYVNGELNFNYSTTVTSPELSNGCCNAAFIEYATGPQIPPTGPTVVPEPATVSLMGAGLIGMLVAWRRRERVISR